MEGGYVIIMFGCQMCVMRWLVLSDWVVGAGFGRVMRRRLAALLARVGMQGAYGFDRVVRVGIEGVNAK